jgi:hypothetical protein
MGVDSTGRENALTAREIPALAGLKVCSQTLGRPWRMARVRIGQLSAAQGDRPRAGEPRRTRHRRQVARIASL